MTVLNDLKKAVAYCEVIKGSYAMMAYSTEDQNAKDTFNNMKTDMEKHIDFLSKRLEYLEQNNELNKEN